MATRKSRDPVIGWREFVDLTDLIDRPIKVKIDKGARTSALLAFALDVSEIDGVTTATFEIHPRSGNWPVGNPRLLRTSENLSGASRV